MTSSKASEEILPKAKPGKISEEARAVEDRPLPVAYITPLHFNSSTNQLRVKSFGGFWV